MEAKQLRTLRKERGWSQRHLAELLGVNISTIWRMEHGELPIRPPMKIAIEAVTQEAVQ